MFHKSARNDVEHPAGQTAREATVAGLSEAIEIIESDLDASAEQTRDAWQYIYESGAFRYLQGFYGRNVERMLEDGYLEP